jgi:hypothetical protein
MNRSRLISKIFLAFTIILATLLLAQSPVSAKTVCSMTLNSPEELNIIKKYFSGENNQYVELGANPGKYCGTQVQCDVFVVSAHFGGNFFGDKGEISLDDVEALSCTANCGNIFGRVKEAYLFGCNTLNGKVRDQRTPQQYVDVLRVDGYGLSQAQRLAANIYSPLGGTYNERMQQVFPNAQNIFGFFSLAPTGKHISPALDAAFAKYPQTPADQWAKSITTDLKRFSFTSTSGKTQADSVICKFANQRGDAEKLKVVREIFERGEGLKVATMLVHFFKIPSLENLDYRAMSELEKIRRNTAARDQLLNFVATSSDAFTIVRLEILEMMQKIGWVGSQQASTMATEMVLRTIPKSFIDPVYVAILYPAVRVAKINYQSLPADYWNHIEMYQVVEGFRATDPYLADRMLQTIRTTSDVNLTLAAGRTLVRLANVIVIRNQVRTAIQILSGSSDPRVRALVEELARSQNETNS